MTPTREILWNIDAVGRVAIYALLIIPFGFLAFGLARRVRMWRTGQPEDRFDQWGTAPEGGADAERLARPDRARAQPLRRASCTPASSAAS